MNTNMNPYITRLYDTLVNSFLLLSLLYDILRTILQAPGPPELISLARPNPKPVQEIVQFAANPIRLHNEKCRFSSCLWPVLYHIG